VGAGEAGDLLAGQAGEGERARERAGESGEMRRGGKSPVVTVELSGALLGTWLARII
jgi:hypothetical protein